MHIVPNVPLFGQLDNEIDKYDTCNMTSLAMVLSYYGLAGNGNGQIEDQLSRYQQDRGLQRGSPTDIAKIANVYGAKLRPRVTDVFDAHASLADIEKSIDANNPVIVHGYFTRVGHIVVVVGYTDRHVVIHDPYGEWFAGGYRTNKTGTCYNLTKATFGRLCDDNGVWTHFFTASK